MINTKSGELFRLAMRNLFGYPLRTFLTMLGVVFGVGSVIAMMALGAGAEHELLEEFGRLGIENVILNTVEPPAKSDDTSQTTSWKFARYGLTFKDEKAIRETVSGVKRVLPVHKRKERAWWGSRKAEVMLHAVEAGHMELFGLIPDNGRPLTAADGADLRRVCVVRAGLLTKLRVHRDPVGLDLAIGDRYYRIVGVLPEDSFVGYAKKALAVDAKTSEVYVPYRTLRERIGTRKIDRAQGARKMTDVQLNQIIVSVDDVEEVLRTAGMLQRILTRNHEDQDYEMVVPLEALEQRRKTQKIFEIALIAIASISLLVGGIGIANITLATVTERTKEIGIRRALGAKRRHIMAQFLVETVVIAALGGLLGVAAGYVMSYLLSAGTGWKGIVTAGSVVLAVGISLLVGVVSGIFPARRAASLDPIAALRHE